MSSNFNKLSEETKKRLHKIEQERIAKEAQTKRKENSERQKEIDILVRDLDPTSKLNQDLFMQNFEDYDNNKRGNTVKENLRNFLNDLSLDKFEGYLRRSLDPETRNILKSNLSKTSYSSGLFGYSSNVTKKKNKDLKNYNAYYKFLHDNLSIPTKEEKKINEKIKKLNEYTREKMNELSKLNQKDLTKLLEKLIELGVLKNLKEKKNNAPNPESSRILLVIDHLKSCEKEILEVILKDLNSKMYAIQQDFSRIKDKVVKKKLEKLVSEYKVNQLPPKKRSNNNVNKSIEGIVSSPQFINLKNEIQKYQKILEKTREIIEESARKNPFKKINTLKGSEAKVYKMTKAINNIIKEIKIVLQKAESKMKSSSSSSGLRGSVSSIGSRGSVSSIGSRLNMLRRRS